MDHFPIIQALCRSALSSPSSAIIHQVQRLKKALEKEGNNKEAKALQALLTSVGKTFDMAPSRIKRSFVMGGEELTQNTPLPADKETSTPLAEVIFPAHLPSLPPLLNQEVKAAIDSILEEWKSYEELTRIEEQPARSCLMYGSPGTGKTQLALWIAKQVNMPVVLARLDGLMSSFLGTSSRNIGSLFAFAAKYRCILLLDEFDAFAKVRNDPQEVGEIKRVVNTLLQSLDSRKTSGFTIGITNHENLLDPAIWRRFDIQVQIPKPSPDIVPALITRFLSPTVLDENQVRFLSWVIAGASGADIESLARWMKKALVLNPKESFINLVKKFAFLNAGRIEHEKRKLLLESEESLLENLRNNVDFPFKLKEMAPLFGITPSALSKNLSKNK